MRLPTSNDAGKSGPGKERTDRPPSAKIWDYPIFNPRLVARLHEAHAYRSSLLRDLWRMRRNRFQRRGVADRRRELVLTRERIARLVGALAAAGMDPGATTVGEKPMAAGASVGQGNCSTAPAAVVTLKVMAGQGTGRPTVDFSPTVRPPVMGISPTTGLFAVARVVENATRPPAAFAGEEAGVRTAVAGEITATVVQNTTVDRRPATVMLNDTVAPAPTVGGKAVARG